MDLNFKYKVSSERARLVEKGKSQRDSLQAQSNERWRQLRERPKQENPIFTEKVDSLGLDEGIKTILIRYGSVTNIQSLVAKTASKVLDINQIRDNRLELIEDKLATRGLWLGTKRDDIAQWTPPIADGIEMS